MNIVDILFWIGGGRLPEGDAGKAREAAKIWGQLADDFESSIKTTGPIAADVWAKNSGDEIDAFKKFWTDEFAPYPEELAAYCRTIQKNCNDYAHVLDQVKFAYIILAVQTWISIIITLAWGWVTGWAVIAEIAALRARARMQQLVIKNLFKRFILMLLKEAIIDSAAYAVTLQATQLAAFGVGDAFGNYDATTNKIFDMSSPYSAGDNAAQLGKNFAANMAFDLTVGPYTKLLKVTPFLGKYLSSGARSGLPNRLANFGGRMLSSETYSVVYNAAGGDAPFKGFSLQQQIDKLIFHGGRLGKNPDKGPVGSKLKGTAWPPARP